MAADTYKDDVLPGPSTSSGGAEIGAGKRTLGPSLPSASDARFYAEEAAESDAIRARLSKKRARAEEQERLDDALGVSKSELVGRDGEIEKKRAKREGDRSFRESRADDTGGLEVREDVLMGSDRADSFKAM